MNGLRKFWLSVAGLFVGIMAVQATHNRAGEITFRHVGGLTYEIIVTTYTKTSGASAQADRCQLEIQYGDGVTDTIFRGNGPSSSTCDFGGELVGSDIKRNIYTSFHTFPGPFQYTIKVEDPNRNQDILNIPGSVNVPFYIETDLRIDQNAGPSSSPILTNPPIDEGCEGTPFEHNPGAYDPDGDSLSYELTVCYTTNGQLIAGFTQPDEQDPGPNNTLTIDPVTGTVLWDSPPVVPSPDNSPDLYNLCFRIDEWRNGIRIGSVLRDMQIAIDNCSNQPPVIQPLEDICVIAGDLIEVPVTANDLNGDLVGLSGSGEPFELTNSPATFPTSPLGNPVTQLFRWQTNCDHVRNQPYQAVFKATDDNFQTRLVDFSSLRIRILSPPPQNPDAQPTGNAMTLSWDPVTCSNATGYKVYRRIDSIGFVPDSCETGVPASTGYVEIARVEGVATDSYVDNNGGLGLVPGQQYCYLLVACFPEGVESIASEEFCAELVKDRPVMTRVSVEATGVNNGRIHVEWAKPTELDTLSAFPGPYRYNVYRTTDISAGFTFITQTSASANLYQSDTIFLDSNLNTRDFQYYYFVEMLSGEDTVGPSSVASSVFLSSQPRDNRLILSWQENVPWTNLEYEVYREQPLNSDNFILLAVVTEPTYIDSNLANGVEYCYRIQSRGRYSSPGFIDPILNFSQEHCNIPEDNEPPCPPVAFIESDCELERTNTITWGNPNLRCPETDDVVAYNVYFSPVLGQPLELLASLPSRDDTVYLDPNLESVAGCYAVTAVDSFQNESVFSDGLCVDNCPIYNLPNVFTPGGDGFNDLFVPFPYRFVESIDLKVFNRWGELVFETTDPDIRWNGEHMDTNQQLSDGVFYYECTVNEIRLQGIVPRLLRGYFHIMNQESSGNGS